MSPSRLVLLSAALLSAHGSFALAQSSTVVGFDGGSNGDFTGNFFFEPTGGNPDGSAHLFLTTFFPSLRTGDVGGPANMNFLGDYSSFGDVTFSMDVKVDMLTDFIGNPTFRPLGIALVDRDVLGPSGPSGVFFELAVLSESGQANWTALSVTIDDPTATTLPPGWIGFGDDDPSTFAPILPAGATFASVLASVDEVRITGAVPGFFFSNANFDMRIDNVAVTLPGGIGTPYCSALPNSTGGTGETIAVGSNQVADNNVTLEASSLPPNVFGIFVVSRTQNITSVASGTLCLGGTIGRYQAVSQIFQTSASGTASLAIDLMAIPEGGTTQAAMSGDTWNFQTWHRDVNGGGAPTANFALPTAVTFQ